MSEVAAQYAEAERRFSEALAEARTDPDDRDPDGRDHPASGQHLCTAGRG